MYFIQTQPRKCISFKCKRDMDLICLFITDLFVLEQVSFFFFHYVTRINLLQLKSTLFIAFLTTIEQNENIYTTIVSTKSEWRHQIRPQDVLWRHVRGFRKLESHLIQFKQFFPLVRLIIWVFYSMTKFLINEGGLHRQYCFYNMKKNNVITSENKRYILL